MTLKWGFPSLTPLHLTKTPMAAKCEGLGLGGLFSDANSGAFPSFLPKEVAKINDPFARTMARKIERLPMTLFETCIMSSCVKPVIRSKKNPVVLLHCFDSSCLEWSYAFPLLEEAGLETWAVDVLGWGFSDLDNLPPCTVETKRSHLYQFWKTYIKRPMVLVGPSLGAAVALDFAVNHPEAIKQVKHRALIIAGEDDRIIPYKDAVRLQCELPNAIMRIITDSGHLPHVDSPASVSKLITDFVFHDS